MAPRSGERGRSRGFGEAMGAARVRYNVISRGRRHACIPFHIDRQEHGRSTSAARRRPRYLQRKEGA